MLGGTASDGNFEAVDPSLVDEVSFALQGSKRVRGQPKLSEWAIVATKKERTTHVCDTPMKVLNQKRYHILRVHALQESDFTLRILMRDLLLEASQQRVG